MPSKHLKNTAKNLFGKRGGVFALAGRIVDGIVNMISISQPLKMIQFYQLMNTYNNYNLMNLLRHAHMPSKIRARACSAA
jgi:hypothetical protein